MSIRIEIRKPAHKRFRVTVVDFLKTSLLPALALVVATSVPQLTFAQTTLTVGDVSFIALQGSADANTVAIADRYAIVPWVNLAAGTVLKFTDNGMLDAAGTTSRNTEHAWIFTVGASPIVAGTTLTFGYDSPTTGKWNGPASGTVSANLATDSGGTANSGISTSGDQIFVYQGTSATLPNIASGTAPVAFGGTLIAGINNNAVITSGSGSANATFAPTALVNGEAFASMGSVVANSYYAGTRSTLTKAFYKTALGNVANFTTAAAASPTFDFNSGFTLNSTASVLWDNNGKTAGTGGTGTWDTTTANKFAADAAGGTVFRWVNSSIGNDHTAVFGGTAGTVTVSGGVIASGLQFDASGYTIGSSTVTLQGSTTPKITVGDVAHTATISSQLAGSAGFTKDGNGKVILTGNNSLSGTVKVSAGTLEAGTTGSLGSVTSLQIESGGTLLLSGAGTDRINNSATVNLNGGKIAFSGNVTEGSSPGTGPLTLSANSIIDFGSGNDVINFGASGSTTWTGTLSIYNWNGNTAGGGNDQLKFGSASGNASLTSAQLGQISFYSDTGSTFLGTGGFVGTLGEVVPVPEPATWVALGGLISLLLWRERRWFSVRLSRK